MNTIEGKWKGAGGGIQLFMLILFSYFGAILGLSISRLIFGDDVQSTVQNLRFFNAIGTIFAFLFPFIIYSFLFTDLKKGFLNKRPANWIVLLLGMLAIVCIQPFVGLIHHYNELIQLPESMADLQEIFEQGEEASKKAMMLLFEEKTISSFLFNILILAILPATLEELFFRGCMQRSILLSSRNIHVAIWITAVIFSLFHFQISGLFPRILLGALLGYLYAWSGNIWVPIAAHFLNNASVVALEQFFQGTSIYETLNSPNESNYITSAISFVLTASILYLIYKKQGKEERINESPSC